LVPWRRPARLSQCAWAVVGRLAVGAPLLGPVPLGCVWRRAAAALDPWKLSAHEQPVAGVTNAFRHATCC